MSLFLSMFLSTNFAPLSNAGKILAIHHHHQATRDMHIFVSYSSKTREQTQGLIDDLEGLGHDVWFDQELTGGHAWWDAILANIRESDLFVIALTTNWLDSQPCNLEYGYAQALGKNILPVSISNIETRHLPAALSSIQFVDYRIRNTDNLKALSRAINKMPPPRPLPVTLPNPPAIPLSTQSRLRETINAQHSLSFQEQAALLIELKELMNTPSDSTDARDLLRKLRQRPDLLATIDQEIGALLNERPSVRPVEPQPVIPVPAQVHKQHSGRLGWIVFGIVILVVIAGAFIAWPSISKLLARLPQTLGTNPRITVLSVDPATGSKVSSDDSVSATVRVDATGIAPDEHEVKLWISLIAYKDSACSQFASTKQGSVVANTGNYVVLEKRSDTVTVYSKPATLDSNYVGIYLEIKDWNTPNRDTLSDFHVGSAGCYQVHRN
jgi:hypothetical protein